MKHKPIEMLKNAKYRIIDEKYIIAHKWRCGCKCTAEVLNLLIGKRIWTRIKFDCGEVIKINCHCLEEIE